MVKQVHVAAFLVFGVCTACGPGKEEAQAYNDKLIRIEEKLSPVHEAFLDQLDAHNLDSLRITQERFEAESKEALDACMKMPDFNGEKAYHEASVNYFKIVNGLAGHEAKEIVDVMCKDSMLLNENDVKRVEVLVNRLDNEYGKVLKEAQEAQEAFAAKWKFKIE